MNRFLSQPINFQALKEGRELDGCNLHQSIAQRIHLVLVTTLGEFRSDPEFGCFIWDNDFENMSSINAWKEKMIRSLRELFERYEPRLVNQTVLIDIGQEEFTKPDNSNAVKIKRRIDLTLRGNIRKTNEPYQFKETLYISPIWLA